MLQAANEVKWIGRRRPVFPEGSHWQPDSSTGHIYVPDRIGMAVVPVMR